MRSSWFAVLVFAASLGCGGADDSVPADAPIVIDGRKATQPPADEHAGHDHAGHDHAGHDHGGHGASGDAPEWVGGPGTLTVVYSNNVDGEIEPCG